MTKIAIIYVDCCRECPYSEKETSGKGVILTCTHLFKEVVSTEIDKDCPLGDNISEP